MSLTAFVGPAGVGKTSRLIQELQKAKEDGRQVLLFLCSDSSELRSRPHVKAGGLMGSRTPGLSFEITHFVSAIDAKTILEELPAGAVAAFDEASWFGTSLVENWIDAERAGVDVVVSSLSEDQIDMLVSAGYSVTWISTPCMLCQTSDATDHLDARLPSESVSLLVCSRCLKAIDRNRAEDTSVAAVLDDLEAIEPFPKERRSYQPLYQIETDGWDFVRPDTPRRAEIMLAMYEEYFDTHLPDDASRRGATYLDLGCATGYFCEYMNDHGFTSTGVDIDEDFLRVARQISSMRDSDVQYVRRDAIGYIEEHPNTRFDVTSSFATVQWVMAQSGLDAGMRCFDWIFRSTDQMCVIEIGYSSEEIYSDKLPITIDKHWMRDAMMSRGGFDEVLFFEASSHDTWRDLFIGLRNPLPIRLEAKVRLPIEDEGELVRQIGPTFGVWDDRWAGARVSFSIACKEPMSRMRIRGLVPDWMDGTSRIRLTSPSHETCIDVDPGDTFDGDLGVVAETGDVLRLMIESDKVQEPPNGDVRHLAFHLKSLKFEVTTSAFVRLKTLIRPGLPSGRRYPDRTRRRRTRDLTAVDSDAPGAGLRRTIRAVAKDAVGIRSLLAEKARLHTQLEIERGHSRDLAEDLQNERRQLNEMVTRYESLKTKAGFVPPGHYYSPIPSLSEVEADLERILEARRRPLLPGIQLAEEQQVALLESFLAYYPEMPFRHEPSDDRRYHLASTMFGYADAIFLYSILRHFEPKTVVEVGSGFSSALMLDTCDLFLGPAVKLTFIEPYPDRLHDLLRQGDEDRVTVINERVQDVPLEEYSVLQAGDVLFIDSTHVSKVGSDVNHLVFEVLPSLKPGVLVHVHDIGFPFDYPLKWIREGRAWNEAYVMRAFLQYNDAFEILFFGSYVQMFHADWLERHMPLAMKSPSGSLWIRKTR